MPRADLERSIRTVAWKLRSTLLIATLLAAGSGCSGALSDRAGPTPRPMPARAQWQGVYQGPYHIHLRILTRGNEAHGTWRAIGERDGEFSGTVSGNLLVMNWTERSLGSAEAWSGHGYFVYQVGKPKSPQQIHGEWGLGSSSTSNSWWAVKRSDRPLDLRAAELLDSDGGDDESGEANSCTVGCDPQEMDTD